MTLPYRDRSLQLRVIGGLEILVGLGLCGVGVLVAIALLMVPDLQQAAGAQSPAAMLPMLAVYPFLGGIALTLGVGLWARRRWARALSLIGAWTLGVLGAFVCVFYALLGPSLFAAVAANMPAILLPPVGMTILAVSVAALMLLLPGAIVAWLLSSEDARLTCEAHDPKERWTDRCPLPVIALALMYGYVGLWALPYAITMPAAVGGRIVSGLPATAFYLLMAGLSIALAWGLYRLRPWGWWGSIVVIAAASINGIVSLRGDGLSEFYRAMGLPESQIRMTMSFLHAAPAGSVGAVVSLTLAAFATWILLIRKHFLRPVEAISHASPPQGS